MTARQQGSATILVVEDDAMTNMATVDAIRAHGYLALSAANADEALLVIAAHSEIDVLFTDIRMPGSIDGLALAGETRRDHPGMEIVIASANRHPAAAQMPTRAMFLPKPYGPGQIADVLRGLIDQTRPLVPAGER